MGKYGDVMPNNPRSVTRTLFANPIFWAMLGAYLAGRVTPLDAPDWIGPASGLVCAILAGLIERWYVYPRTAVAVFKRPPCPEHGDSCSMICRYRPRERHA